LVFKHFTSPTDQTSLHHGPRFRTLWQAIPIIAFTDLAFSLDSVTTALALSKETVVILLGGAIGVLTLRFMAGLFIRWLEEFDHLEDAGFITVAFVGLRLLLRVVEPNLVPPEWLMVALIGAVFAWGFSRRSLATEEELVPESAATVPTEIPDLSLLVELEPHLESTSGAEVLPVGATDPTP
jgi:predicted tellurium resistance membrane protein TerC